MAVVLVEHHMDLVMGVCDRVVVLDFGRVIGDGHAGRGAGRPARRSPPTSAWRPPMLEVEDLVTAYGPVRALDGSRSGPRGRRSPRSWARTGRGRPRCCARCRAWSAPARADPLRRARHERLAVEDIVRLGWRTSRAPRRDRRADGGGEPAAGRAVAARPRRCAAALGEVYELFPRLAERARQPAQHAVGRRAADARRSAGR